MADARTAGGGDFRDPMERLARSSRDILSLLESVPLFQDLSLRERGMFADMAEVVRCPGTTRVFEAGGEGRYLYIVLQGRFELRGHERTAGHISVREVHPGQAAGADSVWTGKPYHWSCVALQNTAAVRLLSSAVREMFAQGQPAAVKLFAALRHDMAYELRETQGRLIQLFEESQGKPISGLHMNTLVPPRR